MKENIPNPFEKKSSDTDRESSELPKAPLTAMTADDIEAYASEDNRNSAWKKEIDTRVEGQSVEDQKNTNPHSSVERESGAEKDARKEDRVEETHDSNAKPKGKKPARDTLRRW